jgi:hypothetical protein
VTSFIEQADRLAGQLDAERADGLRRTATDGDLEALRDAWRKLDNEARRSASEAAGRIAALVAKRPPKTPSPAPGRRGSPASMPDPEPEQPPIPDEPDFRSGNGSTGRFLDE